ncbi:MAG: hypothetical protein IH986_19065 [Planctomycetes bacterium]|nr:hypothetical protein [Planctomycetota bacterium]
MGFALRLIRSRRFDQSVRQLQTRHCNQARVALFGDQAAQLIERRGVGGALQDDRGELLPALRRGGIPAALPQVVARYGEYDQYDEQQGPPRACVAERLHFAQRFEQLVLFEVVPCVGVHSVSLTIRGGPPVGARGVG